MRLFVAVATALTAASLAPALAFAVLWYSLGGKEAISILPIAFLASLLIAGAHALLLGTPAVAWLLYKRSFALRSMLVAGFVVGVGPAAIMLNPYMVASSGTSSWSDGAWKIKDGVPTLAGWIDYLQQLGYAGVLGVIGGIAFYLVYRAIKPSTSPAPGVRSAT